MKKLLNTIGAAVVLLATSPAWANLACGVPPVAPVNCKVGPCVCDAAGQNCKWTFVCG